MQATLKLYPKPEAEFSPFYAFADFDDAGRVAAGTGRSVPVAGVLPLSVTVSLNT